MVPVEYGDPNVQNKKLNNTKDIVLKAIEDLRPYLHNDGGDILVEITRDKRVIIKFFGACRSCSAC